MVSNTPGQRNDRFGWNTFIMTLSTAASAAAAVFTAWFAFNALEQIAEAKKQTIAAQEQVAISRAAQRPWISAEVSVRAALQPGYDNTYLLKLKTKLKNVGETPAQQVIAAFDFAIVNQSVLDDIGAPTSELQQKQPSTCTRNPPGPYFTGSTIFPDQQTEQEDVLFIPIREWEEKAKPHVYVYVVGCVVYYSAADQRDHTTNFSYHVFIKGKDDGGFPRNPTNIRVEQIGTATLGAAELFRAD